MLIRIIIAGCLTVLCTGAFAQNKTGGNLKRAKKNANASFMRRDYVNALKHYSRIEEEAPASDINYRIAVCMYNLKQHRINALQRFERANTREFPEALFYLGNLYHQHMRFDEAMATFEQYKMLPGKEVDNNHVDLLMKKCETAREMVKSPLNVSIHNIGSPINSPYPDYVPLLSADGTMMIFTSRRENGTGKLKDLNGEYMEDIYVSYKRNNEWSIPTTISWNINTDLHDACVALSADGQQLIVYRPSDDMMTGDLYLSSFNGDDWSKPELLGSDINMENTVEASATFSPDNYMIIFSSDRPGGFGGKDLYKVTKLPNGEWSKAVNLGNTVNTPYDEDAPFLHTDGRTLYFSSKAHTNMGGYDIFKSTLGDDGSLSAPENLGYPINTVNDDIYFVVSVNGEVAYFSSQGYVTHGGTDIYYMNIHEQKFDLAVVKCRITGQKGDPVQASITLSTDAGSNVGKFSSSKETGKLIMIVTPGMSYNLTIAAKGYTTVTRQVVFAPGDFRDGVTEFEIPLNLADAQ